jgi:hypothetical protein
MTPFHFGQVNFNMSSVIRVVFFINKVKTIWLVILTNEQWTISLVKLFKYFFIIIIMNMFLRLVGR